MVIFLQLTSKGQDLSWNVDLEEIGRGGKVGVAGKRASERNKGRATERGGRGIKGRSQMRKETYYQIQKGTCWDSKAGLPSSKVVPLMQEHPAFTLYGLFCQREEIRLSRHTSGSTEVIREHTQIQLPPHSHVSPGEKLSVSLTRTQTSSCAKLCSVTKYNCQFARWGLN